LPVLLNKSIRIINYITDYANVKDLFNLWLIILKICFLIALNLAGSEA